MTKKTKKTILLTVLVIILGGAGFGYYMWNKPHRGVKNADSIKVIATELYTQYVKDSAAANKQYTDKILEVNGEVVESTVNQDKQPVIKLKTTEDGAFINCTFEEVAATANPGTKITVKGISSGYSGGDADLGLPGDVVLVRCYLVK
jgi:hypothetical protein